MTWRVAASLVCCAALTSCVRLDEGLVVSYSIEEPAPSVADALKRQLALSNIPVELTPKDDPEKVVTAVLGGEADLGILEEPFTRVVGLTTIVPLYPSILHVLYRQERSADSFPELVRGQQVYAGPVGGTGWRLLGQLADDYQLASDDFTILPDPWLIEPDVYFIVGGLLTRDWLAKVGNYRMFSFGEAGQLGYGTQAEGLALKNPNIRPFILPESLYGALNPSPVLTLATRTVLIGRDDLNPDLAYLIARELIENAHEIAAEYHLVMSELQDHFDPALLALPLHRGARLYLNKDEPGFLERYAEVVGVGLTILAALGSAVLAMVRMNKARRKDRIDVFYRRVLAIRHDLDDVEKNINYNKLSDKLKAIQDEVFQLLIAERLNVDESLTLFLDLSNRVLGEITAKQSLEEHAGHTPGSAVDPPTG